MRSLISGALVVLLLAAPAWALGDSSEAPATSPAIAATAPGITYPPLPTNMSLPTYDYAAPETCAGCHFLLGLDHTSRVLGVIWNDTTQTWQLTGSGWLASRHPQSDHGSTENGFCAKCHSPLQASASAAFNNGVVNAGPIPQQRFQAVTCATCHPPDNITAQIGAVNPDAIDGGAIAIYLWKGVNNPASYQTLSTGVNADGTSKEDALCLNCHEQRHNFTEGTPMYAMMTTTHNHLIPGGGPVRCIDCHNSKYTTFTVTDAQNLIPFIKQQHIDWWSLPPFNGVAQAAVPAHGTPTLVEYKILEREISKIDAM